MRHFMIAGSLEKNTQYTSPQLNSTLSLYNQIMQTCANHVLKVSLLEWLQRPVDIVTTLKMVTLFAFEEKF